MPERLFPERLTTVLQAPNEGGAVSLGVEVGPQGVTFLAQLRLYSRPAPADDAGTAPARAQAGHLGWARDFLERAGEQLGPAIQAEACRALAALADENDRLRDALQECVSATAPLLSHHEEAGLAEGREGDHARAGLALDRAREALACPSLLTPAALGGRPGSRSLPGPR